MRHHSPLCSALRIGSLLSAFLLAAAPAAPAQRSIRTELIGNFDQPVQVIAPPADRSRLMIVQLDGIIDVFVDGVLQTTPFLDISGRTNAFFEQGLFSLAFHPDYATNGWVFVHYTNLNGNTRIDRFTRDATDPNTIDRSTRVSVLKLNQPYSNHNGGTIAFGPDGYLYVGLGDGGSAGDPQNRAQNGQELLGKILRLDVDQVPYQIPADNPFVSDPTVLDEVWALGIRNPWRFSFDRVTGDLWIADVGQNEYEEVNFEQPSAGGGLNYGWRIMEGMHCFNPSSGCNQAGLHLPVHEYTHSGQPFRCSITGGHAYRGEAMQSRHGLYYFADYCSGQTWALEFDRAQQQVVAVHDETSALGNLGPIAGFGEDAAGEVYICSLDGEVYKIVPAGFVLEVDRLVSGSSAEARVSGGPASSVVYLACSIRGARLGATPLPGLGVVSDLVSPQLLARIFTDAQGAGSALGGVPAVLAGHPVWGQAHGLGSLSNVIVQLVD